MFGSSTRRGTHSGVHTPGYTLRQHVVQGDVASVDACNVMYCHQVCDILWKSLIVLPPSVYYSMKTINVADDSPAYFDFNIHTKIH